MEPGDVYGFHGVEFSACHPDLVVFLEGEEFAFHGLYCFVHQHGVVDFDGFVGCTVVA